MFNTSSTDCSAILNIHLEYPEWPNDQKLIKICNNRKNIKSWKGNVEVIIVDAIGYWKLVAQNAINIQTQDNVFTNKEFNFACLGTLTNAHMLRPCGRLIGVSTGSNSSININSEEENKMI